MAPLPERAGGGLSLGVEEAVMVEGGHVTCTHLRVLSSNTMDHFPTNWGRPVGLFPLILRS